MGTPGLEPVAAVRQVRGRGHIPATQGVPAVGAPRFHQCGASPRTRCAGVLQGTRNDTVALTLHFQPPIL